MAYWLFKTEPDVFGLDDIKKAGSKGARWDEVRNYQARNLLRDEVKKGDQVFIYHSQCKPTAIVGLATVIKSGYPDPAQFNPESAYFDPKAQTDAPRWFCVDIKFLRRFEAPISLQVIKQTPQLESMLLLKQGRLSVQPVAEPHAEILLQMADKS